MNHFDCELQRAISESCHVRKLRQGAFAGGGKETISVLPWNQFVLEVIREPSVGIQGVCRDCDADATRTSVPCI